jgi:hypothetical protein
MGAPGEGHFALALISAASHAIRHAATVASRTSSGTGLMRAGCVGGNVLQVVRVASDEHGRGARVMHLDHGGYRDAARKRSALAVLTIAMSQGDGPRPLCRLRAGEWCEVEDHGCCTLRSRVR